MNRQGELFKEYSLPFFLKETEMFTTNRNEHLSSCE